MAIMAGWMIIMKQLYFLSAYLGKNSPILTRIF